MGLTEFKSNSVEYSTPADIFNPLREEFNIYVYDCSDFDNKKFLKGFMSSEDAEKFIEKHPTPNILDCEFDPYYEKRVLQQFEEEQKLTVFDLRVLNLISLDNPIRTISKVLEKEGKSICPFIAKLNKRGMIKLSLLNNWEITEKGSLFLKKSIAKGDLCYE